MKPLLALEISIALTHINNNDESVKCLQYSQ